jgi:hypothetical protein
LDAAAYLDHIQNITESESPSPPPPIHWNEIFPCGGAPQSDYIPEPLEHDAQDCLEMNLQYNPYYPFPTCEEDQYIRCGVKMKGMKTYYDTVLEEENTALRFPGF